MNAQQVYLDYNATCPIRPQVIDIMSKIMERPLNASSVHSYGREGKKHIEEARRDVAALCGADPSNVIFNSGASEGNNTILQYFARQDVRIITSALEHPSVLEATYGIGAPDRVPAKRSGIVDIEALEEMLKESQERGAPCGLVSVMLVNNETGVIQPVSEISAVAQKYGALVHCDAVQGAGRIPTNMAELGVHFLTLSAHKMGGPQGVGALVLGLCGETPHLIHGGGQEKQNRAGTENVAGIAGFGQAAKLARDHGEYMKLAVLRDRLEAGIRTLCPDAIIFGQDAPRVAGVSFFAVPDTSSETLLMAFDLEGVMVSNGSACSSGRVKSSYVLEGMGYNQRALSGALRVSMGWNTKETDIDRFLEVWSKIYKRVKK